MAIETIFVPERADEPCAPFRVGMLIETTAGWATYRQNLERVAQRTSGLDPHWHDITFHRPGGTVERLRARWPQLVPRHQSAVARAVFEFRQGLRQGPYEAMLTNSAMAVLFRRQLRATPTILVVDSTQQQLDEMQEYGVIDHSAWTQRLKFRMGCGMFHAAERILATSKWAKTGVVATYGVSEDKVIVNPHGVDVSFWHPSGRPGVDRKPTPRVLFVGGDFRRKGGELLLDWVRSRSIQDVELHVVTRDPVEPLPGVIVHDDIGPNSPELLGLYQSADVFVLPSLAEAFGIATIEAMACGLPVVVSDSGGTADIVDHGINGFITAVGDRQELASALEALLGDPVRRTSMGTQSRRIAEERFDLERTARVPLDLLAALAAERRHK